MTRASATWINAGLDGARVTANGGSVQFRTGEPPESIDDPAIGTLLAEVELENPAFGAASEGTITAAGLPLSTTAVADGTIGYARVIASDGTALLDEVEVGIELSPITVNTLVVATGATVTITAFTVTQPTG